jgi:hypothetical protein
MICQSPHHQLSFYVSDDLVSSPESHYGERQISLLHSLLVVDVCGGFLQGCKNRLPDGPKIEAKQCQTVRVWSLNNLSVLATPPEEM